MITEPEAGGVEAEGTTGSPDEGDEERRDLVDGTREDPGPEHVEKRESVPCRSAGEETPAADLDMDDDDDAGLLDSEEKLEEDGEPVFDEDMVEHIQLVTGLIEGREVSREEVIEMLTRKRRQHSIGEEEPDGYGRGRPAQEEPP